MSTVLRARGGKFLTHIMSGVGSLLCGFSGASLVRDGHWEPLDSQGGGAPVKKALRNRWEEGVR